MKSIVIILIAFFLAYNLVAQKIDTVQFKEIKKEQVNQNPTDNRNNYQIKELEPTSSWEFTLSLIVLGFGVLVIGMEVFLAWKQKIKEENLVQFIVVTLIITSTLFLITAGYDNNQIAPAMGLLGTIAGYTLGKNKRTES